MMTLIIRQFRVLVLWLLILGGAMVAPAFSAIISVDLVAEKVNATMPDATVIPMWGFRESTDATNPGVWRIPTISAVAGDSLTINLTNDLNVGAGLIEPASIMIPGQKATEAGAMTPQFFVDGQGRNRVKAFTHEAAAGNTDSYEWLSLKAGTYLIQSATHTAVQMQMGLYAILKVDAVAGSRAYGDGSTTTYDYDSEVTLLFSEIDPILHEAVSTGVYGTGSNVPSTGLPMTSTMDYNPKYFLVNGQPYSAGAAAIAAGDKGNNILLRLLNAGLKTRMPLLQGAYLTMLAEDGNPSPYTREQYSIDLAAGKTMDAMIKSAPAGNLAVYDRRLALSNAGASAGGMFAQLHIVGIAGATLAPDLASPQLVGTPQVIFTAGQIGGSVAGSYEYRFLLDSGSGAVEVQAYSTSNTWTWSTSALAFGSYGVTVQVRTVGSLAAQEAATSINYVLVPPAASGATLSPDLASPQLVGTPQVIFTAGGTGGSGSYEYRFLLDSGAGGIEVQTYSTSNTWTWDTSALVFGSYDITVQIRSEGSIAGQEAATSINYVLAPPAATGATLSPDLASPQLVGTPQVIFTAGGTGGSGSYEYRFLLDSGAGGIEVQAYSTSNTWPWDTSTLAFGSYDITVQVRSFGSTAAQEAATSINYVLVPPAATGATLVPDLASPQQVGTPQVIFTAGGTGGSGSYEYRFWLNSGAGYTIAQDYSTTSTWTWNTSALAAGSYTVVIHVRNVGSSAWNEAESGRYYILAPPAASGASLVPDLASPQAIGTPQVVFTAGGTGGSGSYEYRFWLNSGTGWTIAQDYSTTSTWTWNTSALPSGSYTVIAHVRNVGSTAWNEAESGLYYILEPPAPPAATGASLVPDLASPQAIGTPQVVFTAGGTGGSGSYEYRFWLNSGAGWTIAQDYSTTSTWTWNTSALPSGSYTVIAHVRNVGSTAWNEAESGLYYVIQ